MANPLASALATVQGWLGTAAPEVRALPGEAEKASQPSTTLQKLTPYGQPPPRGTRERLQAYRRQPWWRAIAGKVARATSATKWHVYRRGMDRTKPGAELTGHPLDLILRRPNPVMSGSELIEITQLHLDTDGNAFWVLERNAFGQPVEIYPIPPSWVMRTASSYFPWFQFSHLNFQSQVPEQDVIWIREPDPENPYGRGTGFAEALSDDLDADEFAAKQVKTYFFNSSLPSAIVTIKGAGKDEVPRIQESFAAKFQNFWKANRTHFTNGDVTVNRLDTSFKDMDLVNLRKAERDTVRQVLGVPPEILGILDSSNRSTIDSADFLMAKHVVAPRLFRLRDGINHWLVPQFGDPTIEADFDNPIPDDRDFALKAMQQAPSAFTKDEIRKLSGFAPLPAGAGAETLQGPPPPPFIPPGPSKADPPWAHSLPARRKNIAADAIEAILNALRPERLTKELDPVWTARVTEWGQDALDTLGMAPKFDLLNPLITPYVRQFGTERIKGMVDGTTRDNLRSELVTGIQAGESSADIAKRVESVFAEATDARANTIARTEVLRASNWATTEAQKVSGVVASRKWVATPDSRTREEHRALNGQVRGVNELFTIDGQSGPYPGGFSDPAMSINCRCTTVAVIEDPKAVGPEEEAVLVAAWKKYDTALVPWETEAEAACQRGFLAQRDDILRKLAEFN